MPRAARTPEPVATLLTPAERQRVDAAGEGCYVTLHRENVDELLLDLREQRATAVLVSVNRYANRDAPQFARIVREFPRVPAVALLSANEPYATQAVLAMGQQGVRSLVDVRDPRGWRDLRQIIQRGRRDTIEQTAIGRIHGDLYDAPAECLRFFEALFSCSPSVTTIQQFARALGIVPSTFMSRFFRAKLPAAKRYLAMARLVRVARVFENPGLSIAQVSNRLEYSSPQSFSRHINGLLGCTPLQFRRMYDGEKMLDRMREDVILPYRDILRRFHPLSSSLPWET